MDVKEAIPGKEKTSSTLTMQDSMFVFPTRGWCSCLFTPLIMTACPLTSSCLWALDTFLKPIGHDSQSTRRPD